VLETRNLQCGDIAYHSKQAKTDDVTMNYLTDNHELPKY